MKNKLMTILFAFAGMLLFLYVFANLRQSPHPLPYSTSFPSSLEGMGGRTTDWPMNVHFTLDESDEIRAINDNPYGEDKPDYMGMFTEADVLNKNAEYTKINELPLRELTVKGAYNSAFDGQTFSIKQLGEVMANGCRFLDFQVFCASGGTLYVGHSDTPRADLVDTSLPLVEVLGYISQFAFTADNKIMPSLLERIYEKDKKDGKLKETEIKAGAPIQQTYVDYPLFVNLRINRNENSDVDIIDALYSRYINPDAKTPIIPEKFFYRSGKLANQVTMWTQLKELQGKIIFMMDIDNLIQNYTTSYNADDVPIKVRAILQRFVNVKTGGHTWKTFNDYSTVEAKPILELTAMDNGMTTNCANIYTAYPSFKNTGNPDALSFIKTHRIQHSPQRHYIKDANLEKYNTFFDKMKKPMVPMAHALGYVNGNSQK